MAVSNLSNLRAPAATSALARRLEAAEAAVNARFAAGPDDVATVAGGVANFCGAGSPLTQAIALGMNGTVSAEEMDSLEDFFRSRAANVALDLCPYADLSLIEMLGERGYRMAEFTNKLVRPVVPDDAAPFRAGVRICSAAEMEVWARTLGRGFFNRDDIGPLELQIFEMMFRGSTALLADIDGQPVGGGAFAVHEGVALFYSDATVPAARGKGVQQAVILARLAMAAQQGCELAVASTTPGSLSQRNYERLGFQVAYTRVIATRTF